MKIYDLSISNFRGIEKLEKLKVGDINSFVGKNDSGKSNILKALDSFFNEKFDSNDVFKGIGEDEKTEITIRFEPQEEVNSLALDKDGKINLKKTFSFASSGKLNKNFFYTCNDIDDENYENSWGVKESDINAFLSNLEVEYSKSGRGVTNLSKIELLDQNTEEFGRKEKQYEAADFLKNIKKQYDFVELPDYSLFDAEQDLNISSTSFQNQFKPIATESLNNNLELTNQIESNVKDDLETEFSLITELMQKNVPDLEKINTSPVCNWKNLVKFDLSLKFKSDTYDIPISNKGTGFKRLLMVAYFEYLAQKTTKRHQIFGVEEPETFLHPALQHDLLDSILELADSSQFFLTTHSPVFAGSTRDSNIVVVKKENEKSNYLNYENEEEILDVVIEELGIRPNYNLLNDNYRKVIFVEGSGDVRFWEIAITKINGEFPEDILFVPCGGDQVEFYVNAQLCKKINRRFLVVLDSDKGAVDYQQKLANKRDIISKVEAMDGETAILQKREIENYYSRAAIARIIGDRFELPEDFQITDYCDVKEEIKEKILQPSGVNFKAKNNFQVFNEMTKDEWIASAAELNETTDLEDIIEKILS
ncbi:ATP-dependent nuclease [Zunongwangia profunda]|uniref:ATP-dependent nuclease n=1 Tax=Zunongwangia profunda TaxID=398743 RepID=UPI001D18E9CD|nr:AAA family ATPase [Zunongwangia profunda]MCC4229643.1 ATP-binding protein [Zunongwangia profunda]